VGIYYLSIFPPFQKLSVSCFFFFFFSFCTTLGTPAQKSTHAYIFITINSGYSTRAPYEKEHSFLFIQETHTHTRAGEKTKKVLNTPKTFFSLDCVLIFCPPTIAGMVLNNSGKRDHQNIRRVQIIFEREKKEKIKRKNGVEQKNDPNIN